MKTSYQFYGLIEEDKNRMMEDMACIYYPMILMICMQYNNGVECISY